MYVYSFISPSIIHPDSTPVSPNDPFAYLSYHSGRLRDYKHHDDYDEHERDVVFRPAGRVCVGSVRKHPSAPLLRPPQSRNEALIEEEQGGEGNEEHHLQGKRTRIIIRVWSSNKKWPIQCPKLTKPVCLTDLDRELIIAFDHRTKSGPSSGQS